MKKNYFDPEMKISAFSRQNVLTASGEGVTSVTGTASTADAFNGAANKTVVDYAGLNFTL